MALVAMAVYSTEENQKHPYLSRCLQSLSTTVDWAYHRLHIVDNGSCQAAKEVLRIARSWLPFNLTTSETNRGTALAINSVWRERKPDECCVKHDDDILHHEAGWLNVAEECIRRDPKLGILGLKRTDLAESPLAPKGCWSHSTLIQLPHKPGQRWLHVERAAHVMGSVQVYNPLLLDRIGYLVQFGKYGLDDALACKRSELAGFYNAFYAHYLIDHIDPGGTPYQAWKERYAGETLSKFDRVLAAYATGKLDIRHGPEEDLNEVLNQWQ